MNRENKTRRRKAFGGKRNWIVEKPYYVTNQHMTTCIFLLDSHPWHIFRFLVFYFKRL